MLRDKFNQSKFAELCGKTVTQDGTSFDDLEVTSFVKKHLRLRDRLCVEKIGIATILAFYVFLGEADIVSENKNWKFFAKDMDFKWKEELE